VTPKELAAAARAGDTAVGAAITRAAEWLGIGVANIVTALHPDLVVLGGGVAALDDLLLNPVRAALKERVRMFPVDGVRVERSAPGRQGGPLGRNRAGRKPFAGGPR
jgi:glucokinase